MIRLSSLIPINETGEGTSRPYPYKRLARSKNELVYRWKTESDLTYTLTLDKDQKEDIWKISFRTEETSYGDTNRGELYRIMSTVASIVKDEIRRTDRPYGIEWITTDPRRARVYAQWIKNAIGGVKGMEQDGMYTVMFLKETGEGSAKPYVGAKPISRNQWGSVWSWTTDTGVDYELQIDKEGHPVWWISFEVKPTSKMKWRGAYADVNRGEVWRVMATVSLIVKAELKRTKDRISIGFRGADERRARVFIRYIMATFPGSKLSTGSEGRYAKVELKPKK